MVSENTCQFETVGIIGKYGDADISSTLALVINVLRQMQCQVLLDKQTIKTQYPDKDIHACEREELTKQADLVIAIGGDGSFLAASRSIIEHEKPITGVNMGRLGFLTDISPNEVNSILHEILTGKYTLESRTILASKVIRDDKVIAKHIAVNDVVIHKTSVARMVELDVYLNNRFLSSYHADGLIISSPTGSTAYALSSGGPILQGNLDALLLVPICPHTLTQRPIVIHAKTEQRIEISKQNNTELQVTIDGQEQIPLQNGDQVLITSHSKKLNIYHPCDYDNLRRLRKKLGWGTDPSK